VYTQVKFYTCFW